MSYEEKYKESKKSADLLYKQGLYNSAVNRYYYCIYQFILEYNNNNNIVPNKKLEDNKDLGTHEKRIETFISNYKFDNKENYEDIKSYIYEVKDFRKRADYYDHNIPKIQLEKCKESFYKVYCFFQRREC